MKGSSAVILALTVFFLSAPMRSAFADAPVAYGEARDRALEWLRSQMVPNDTVPEPEPDRMHLALSYRIPESESAYRYLSGRSMTYDNALAAIAFTMAGDYQNAAFILNALSRLTRADGTLWFGYNTQNSWPSEEDSSGALDRTGSTAWAGYAAVFYILHRSSEDPDFLGKDREAQAYLRMAESIAGNIISRIVRAPRDPRFGLSTGGENAYSLQYESGGVVEVFREGPIDWASAEHNIDAWFFLTDLGLLTGKDEYLQAAATVKDALVGLWSASDGQYYQGAKVDRIDGVMALDCASWGSLFSLSAGKKDLARASLKAIEKKYRSSDLLGGVQVRGYKPYESRPLIEDAGNDVLEYYYKDTPTSSWKEMNGVWGEGSLGVAFAYLKQGQTKKAGVIIDDILKLQTDDGGVRYFTREIPHEFVSYPSVASTAWLAIVLLSWDDPALRASFMGLRL